VDINGYRPRADAVKYWKSREHEVVALKLDQTRRQFLRTAAASAGSMALSACGGGHAASAGNPGSTGEGVPPDTGGPTPAPGADPQAKAFAWQIAPEQTLVVPAGDTANIATGAAGLTIEMSPDLPPGRTLSMSAAGDITIVAAADAPDVDIRRPWAISVLDSELATAQNMRTGQVYGYTQSGPRRNIQYAISEAGDGDTIQISPGAIWSPGVGDGSTYLEGACLHVWKALTITNIPGQARWRLAPQKIPYVAGMSGLVIREPNQTYSNPGNTDTSNPRKTIVIQGFDFNNWGINGDDHGIRVRNNSGASSWDGYHASVTFRNFKLGKLPFFQSASGIAGAAENLIIEDGHVYDTGGGVASASGNDHNFYISGRNLTMRGVRGSRNRSAEYPFNQANTMDGHILKLTFNNMLIEGCAFDCGPEGDNSITIQSKGGGNLVVRSCLLISGVHSQTATGSIVFEKEQNNYGGWMYGLEGHSVLVERCVFINHRPYVPPGDARGMVFCRPPGNVQQVDPATITSFVVRDNIGMSTVPDSGWIVNPPPAFPGAWSAQNSVMPYFANETGFSQRELLRYLRTAGPITTGNRLSTLRFVYPHGYEARNDSYQGLG
jgi:hypothetical protein